MLRSNAAILAASHMDMIPTWQRWVILEDLEKIYPLAQTYSTLQQQSNRVNDFPFQKLPPEVQLIVLRFAMPQCGIRPLPFPSEFNKIDPSCIEYVEALRRERITALNLLQVNHWISSESIKIFYAETVLHIDVEPTRIRFGGTKISEHHRFRGYTFLQNFKAFTHFRNYELQIHLRGAARFKAIENQRIFRDVCLAIKEWLRMISDALSTNPCIDHMAVKMLGLCALRELDPPITFDPTPTIIDCLAPLTRLRVHKTAVFSAHYHARFRILYEPCSHHDPHCIVDQALVGLNCQDWIQKIQEAVGPLEGARLSEQEALWKQIKHENHIPPPKPSERCLSLTTSRMFRRAWRCLNLGSGLESLAMNIFQHLDGEYAEWQENLRLARQYQYQKLGKDREHPILIDDDTPERNGEDRTWWSP